jgi:hypothetical protein
MKQPPTLRTGDPSYLVVASTSGSASPTVLTDSKVSAGVSFVGLRFIEAQYSPSRDAIQANLRNCKETGACSPSPEAASTKGPPEVVPPPCGLSSTIFGLAARLKGRSHPWSATSTPSNKTGTSRRSSRASPFAWSASFDAV